MWWHGAHGGHWDWVTGGHLARKCEITGHWLSSPNCRPTWELTGNLGYNLAFFAIKHSLKLACGEATTLSCEGWTLEVILRRWVSNPRTVEMGERVGLILRPPPMHWSTLLKLSWYHQSEKCFATEQVIQVYNKWPKQSSITQWLNHVPPRRQFHATVDITEEIICIIIV